ncbi:hypothetical protein [Streptomyces scabiei]|uniref:hypothetical protein n=2 Tax=Streptomyces scabiei TaxID=1930 RepID=UPI000AA2D055|nr:hypothetical protein [Streptomyces scabiei]MDX2540038.1 hypothetical protein [Streptomyces scabiei]MDX2802365.1 hypothetical protein [Streptomyces scabiei]MDX2858497.1 hypothetical protein [Streptomyces scabiei]MDX3035252.1 hypothetical protein [Streptomyces scabiei]MDX3213709.1 hypothetical protein [Streptomyces scabiei]
MTTGRKTTIVFLTVLCALLLTILGLVQEWPAWAWAALALTVIGAPAAAFKIAATRRGSLPADFTNFLPAAPIERREHHVSRVALPSRWPDYDFVFSATVRWHPLETHGDDPVLNPAGLAVEAVLDRARTLTEQREPGRASLVQHELSGALSRMRPDHTGHLQVMAEDVTLTLHEPDQERLTKLAEIRKDKAVWEHQRTYEQSKREYLGDDVLKDTGSAVVWWLAKNDNHIEKTVADLGLLAQLTSAANDADIPERLQDLIPTFSETSTPAEREPTASDHFDAFLTGMGFTSGDDRRGMLTKQIADIIRTQDKHETADELLRRYDPPAAFTSNADDQPEEPEHPR